MGIVLTADGNIMSRSVNIVTAGTEGWQKRCRQWAQDGKVFEVRGVSARHLGFCKKLCDEFRYECHYDSGGEFSEAQFSPIMS